MQMLLRIFTVVIILAGSVWAQQKQLLRFGDYPVAEKFNGRVAPVKISGSQARKFRSALKEDAKVGVNFAGHYIISTWGCGTDCRELAIIDARTGAVYFTPSLLLVVGEMGQNEDRLQFRKNSRLLIIVGSRNEEGNGKYFYLWKNNRLQLIRTVKS